MVSSGAANAATAAAATGRALQVEHNLSGAKGDVATEILGVSLRSIEGSGGEARDVVLDVETDCVCVGMWKMRNEEEEATFGETAQHVCVGKAYRY